MLAVAVPVRVPIDISGDDGRAAARRELSKGIYHEHDPGLMQRVLRWILDRVLDFLNRVGDGHPALGFLGLAVLVFVAVVAVLAIRLKLGPLARSQAAGDALFSGQELSAAEHRAAAERFAAAAAWAEAIRERLRAIIRELEQRGLIEPRAGRTADEAAQDAGRVLPSCAAALSGSVRTFDDVWYGGREATREMYELLREVDATVRTARPAALAEAR